MEALIRLCVCTSKSSLVAYDILLLFLCCGSDYYVGYYIQVLSNCHDNDRREATQFYYSGIVLIELSIGMEIWDPCLK